MFPHEHPGDVTSRAAGVSNVMLAASANEKLDRIVQLLEQIALMLQPPFPPPPPEPDNNARAFLDGLRGKTLEEIRAANRERNNRLKTAQ